jgi:uncharacterized protein YjiS (DUF1127 family)
MLILSSVLSAAPLRGARRLLAGLSGFQRALSNRMAVRELAHLDDHALKDIGLTRSDVQGALEVSLRQDPSCVLTGIAGSGHGRAMQAPRAPVTSPSNGPDPRHAATPGQLCC